MQLDAHLHQVTDQLSAAAALGDDRTQQIAASLATAAAPAVRLAVLGAITDAADEITAALLDAPGAPSVSIHLNGAEAAEVVVDVRFTQPPDADGAADAAGAQRADASAGEPTARISLRLSEALKSDIDDAAAHDGVSVNTWLVRAATTALRPSPFDALGAAFDAATGGGLSGRTGASGRGNPWGGPWGGPGHGRSDGGQRITGWVNG